MHVNAMTARGLYGVSYSFPQHPLEMTRPRSISPEPQGCRNILNPTQIELTPNPSARQLSVQSVCVSSFLRPGLSIGSYQLEEA